MISWSALRRLESRETLIIAILLAVIAHLADIVTSLSCQLTTGCYESNTLMTNSYGYFSLTLGTELKSIYFIFWIAPLCYFIYRYTRSYLLTSIPLVYQAYIAWMVVLSNLMILASGKYL